MQADKAVGFRQNINPYPDLQLGKRTKAGTESVIIAAPAL